MTTLPVGWCEATGDDLFAQVRGVSYQKSAVQNVPGDGFVPILRANNIDGGVLNRIDLVFVPKRFVADEQMLRPGDFMIAASSGSKSVVGKGAPATDEVLGASFGAFCSVARPREIALAGWLKHFFQSNQYRRFVESVALGININNLRGSDLARLPIPMAPLAEQRRIVVKLDRLMARTARARAELAPIADQIGRYRRALLRKAFRGELTSGWRAANAQPPIGESAFHGAPFAIPDGWCWSAAQNLVEPGAEIVYGIVQPGPQLADGVPYVRGLDIVDGVIQVGQLARTSPQIAARYHRASLKGGDVLLGIIRATKVAIVPPELDGANITQGTARFRPSSAIRTAYLARWLESPDAQQWLHARYRGIDMPGLNLRDVRQCPIPLAPVDEQDEIVSRIESAFAWLDKVAHEHAQATRLLGHLDQALLAKAFRGELVSQDPADEPADKLLARIRAEREGAAPPARKRKAQA